MKRLIFICMLALVLPTASWAQGSAFSFQGRLNDGTNPANGAYDLQFQLFDSITAGNQIGPTRARPGTPLINGVFSVTLDFGATAFNNPNAVFIEIGVKPAGSPNAFTILGPRQQLTVVPMAVRAMNATNADNAANAQNSVNATNATTAANANLLNGLNSSDFVRNSVAPVANQNFNIVGNGIINGNLTVAGTSTTGGNATQNRDKGGLTKAMVYVAANGTITRCYNGITGDTTPNCGYNIVKSIAKPGRYRIDLGFRVNDRFVSVTAEQTANVTNGVNIGTGYFLDDSNPNHVWIQMYIPDVSFNSSGADNPFMIVVY